MDSILYYTKGTTASEQEKAEIAKLRRECDFVCVRNGSLRNANSVSFETGFGRVVESSSVVEVKTDAQGASVVDPKPKAAPPAAKPTGVSEQPWRKNP